MPLYDYRCPECGHTFERLGRFSDGPTHPCSVCGAAAKRLLGVPALQFKGSGWYVTDYGRGNSGPRKPGGGDGGSSSSPGSSSPGGSAGSSGAESSSGSGSSPAPATGSESSGSSSGSSDSGKKSSSSNQAA